MIVPVEVEDKPTGSFAISGGYSTTDGAIAEVSVTETNFLGRGQYVKLCASEGQYSRGWSATFTEPYFLDQRIAAGFDIYHKEQLQNNTPVLTNTTGVKLRLGLPVTDDLTFQPHYSIYESQIVIPNNRLSPITIATSTIRSSAPPTPGFTLGAHTARRIQQLLDQRRGVAGDEASGRAGHH